MRSRRMIGVSQSIRKDTVSARLREICTAIPSLREALV